MRQAFSQLSTPTKIFFPYIFVSQFIATFYAAFERPFPAAVEFISPIVFLWILAWWLKQDARRTGYSWPIDTGMFLYLAWILLLPYYLFKTRGLKAFIPILALLISVIAGWLAAAAAIVLIWY